MPTAKISYINKELQRLFEVCANSEIIQEKLDEYLDLKIFKSASTD